MSGRSKTLVGICAALMLTLTPAASEESQSGQVLATVGDHSITLAEVEDKLQGTRRSGGASAEELLQRMIRDELVLLAAEEADLRSNPEVQKKIFQLLVESYRSRELKPRLDQLEVTEEEIREYYDTHKDRYSRGDMVLSFEQVKGDARYRLLQDRRQEETEKFHQELRERFDVEVSEDMLEDLTKRDEKRKEEGRRPPQLPGR